MVSVRSTAREHYHHRRERVRAGQTQRRRRRRRRYGVGRPKRIAPAAHQVPVAVGVGDHQLRHRVQFQRVPVPFLEPGVSQQTAGVHAAQPDVAVGSELRRVRSAERRAQHHATRLLRADQGRQAGQPAEPQVGRTGRQRSADRQRDADAVLGHGPVVPVRVQRRPTAARGGAQDRRGRGRFDHVPQRMFGSRVVLPGKVRLYRRIPGQRLFQK